MMDNIKGGFSMKKLLILFLTLSMCFSAAQATVLVSNPWIDATPDDFLQLVGVRFGLPEDAQDVSYRLLIDESLCEMHFTWQDIAFTARLRPVMDWEDISGMYYTFTQTPVQVNRCEGNLLRAQDGENDVLLCLWYDLAPGLMYSLSAVAPALSDDMLLEAANAVFIMHQHETDE